MRQLFTLAVVVLGLHAWLASFWPSRPMPVGQPTALRTPAAVLVLHRPAPAPAHEGLAGEGRPGQWPTPADSQPARAGSDQPRVAPLESRRPDAVPAEPVRQAAGPARQELDATPAVDRGEAAGPRAAPAAAVAGDGATDPPSAEPPPIYPTRVPAPVLLRYALRYNGQAGEATLDWRHDGQAYSLQLDGHGAQRPLVEQASRGGFDAAGLAPERFIDRRRGARWQAANFRRDIGRIAFSGPAIDYPAWPGAQDRLSWLAQMVAIRTAAVAAAPGAAATPEADISLFVVDARGAGGLWRFVHQGEVLLASPLGPQAAQLWRREPPRPEGLRVEAWLDASRHHWPLQLRFTALRSGDVFELVLLAEPALPP